MQYALLVYGNETASEKAPPAARDAITKDFDAFTAAILKAGKYRGGEALQRTRTATTVRTREGRVITSDGPFGETKEQLGGFFLIDAANLDEAMDIAARVPSVRAGGSVEIRPVLGVARDGAARSPEVQPLELTRRFDASPEAAFDAWLTRQWAEWVAPQGTTCEVLTLEPSGYHLRMAMPDGRAIEVTGVFLDVSRPGRLELTWTGSYNQHETRITVTFRADGAGTLMTLLHERFADAAQREGYARGWAGECGAFDKLSALLAGGARPADL